VIHLKVIMSGNFKNEFNLVITKTRFFSVKSNNYEIDTIEGKLQQLYTIGTNLKYAESFIQIEAVPKISRVYHLKKWLEYF